MKVLRIEMLFLSSRRVRAHAVLIGPEHRVLRIVREEFPSIARLTRPYRIEVVRAIIARQWCVKATHVEDRHHVIDEIHCVDVFDDARIVLALHV